MRMKQPLRSLMFLQTTDKDTGRSNAYGASFSSSTTNKITANESMTSEEEERKWNREAVLTLLVEQESRESDRVP